MKYPLGAPPFIHWVRGCDCSSGYRSVLNVKNIGDTIVTSKGRTVRTPTRAREYLLGNQPPNYPVPATEFVNAMAMSPDRVPFGIKARMLRFYLQMLEG